MYAERRCRSVGVQAMRSRVDVVSGTTLRTSVSKMMLHADSELATLYEAKKQLLKEQKDATMAEVQSLREAGDICRLNAFRLRLYGVCPVRGVWGVGGGGDAEGLGHASGRGMLEK